MRPLCVTRTTTYSRGAYLRVTMDIDGTPPMGAARAVVTAAIFDVISLVVVPLEVRKTRREFSGLNWISYRSGNTVSLKHCETLIELSVDSTLAIKQWHMDLIAKRLMRTLNWPEAGVELSTTAEVE